MLGDELNERIFGYECNDSNRLSQTEFRYTS